MVIYNAHTFGQPFAGARLVPRSLESIDPALLTPVCVGRLGQLSLLAQHAPRDAVQHKVVLLDGQCHTLDDVEQALCRFSRP